MISFTKARMRWLNYASHLVLVIAVVQIIALVGMIDCLQFHYPNFNHSKDVSFEATSNVSGSTAWLLPDPNLNWATDPNNDSATLIWSGWMAYDEPITFMDSANGKANSFNTSFTFKLITDGVEDDSPSGMAFFISSTGSRPWNAVNRYFGLSNGTEPASFFAVEFDTRASSATTDPSGSHVGIDINSVNSSFVADTSNISTSDNTTSLYPQLYLYNNYTFKAWIAYDAASNLTTVWMTNETIQYAEFLDPPTDLQPIIEYKFDLYSTFSQYDMYVGFSAATESDSAMLGVAIYSWYFSIMEDNSQPAPAPAPPLTRPPPPPKISATSTSPPPPSPVAPSGSSSSQSISGATAVLVLIFISQLLFWI